MKLIYNGKRLVNSRDCGYDIDTDFRQAGLTLYQCVEAGFIVAEIFHAKRNPHIWHDYSRSTKPESEALPPGVRTESEVIADLTKQVGALLEACYGARNISQNILDNLEERLTMTPLQLRHKLSTIRVLLTGVRDDAQAAIALVEPKKEKPRCPSS